MEKKAEISVLVPCYNVEKYLNQCIDSIIGQTFTDMEIICINDGSTDGTLGILEEYAAKDERIIIIDKPNSGYGDSMNIGLAKAQGKYIGIIESDDYIESDMFESLHKEAEKHNLELVKCLFHEWNEITGKEKVKHHPFKDKYGEVLDPRKEQRLFLTQPAIWAGLYRKEFLDRNGIRFLATPGASFQDTSFAFKVYASANRVMFIPKVLHHYRINGNSSVTSPGKVFCVCDEEMEIRRYAQSIGVEEALGEVMALRAFASYKWNYNRLSSLKLKRQFMEKWSEESKELFKKGEVTRRFFSRSRIFRLYLIAHCHRIYYFTKKI